MTTRFAVTLVAATLLVGGAALPARTPLMPVDEVRPGMIGRGVTVFAGTAREEFTAHILGVLENVMGPRRHLILARLEGGPLAQTGVIAGMSGSPVYIDGRLIGAVGYSLGAFTREPIAGITPIAEMVDATATDAARRPLPPIAASLPLDPHTMVEVMRRAFAAPRPFAERPDELRTLAGSALDHLGVQLKPIATPVSLGGFSGEANALLSGLLREAGFVPVAAGAAPSTTPAPEGPLQPGDAVGVTLVGGDLMLGATGTVTHVDGDRVYAFGHPFYNLGPTAFPMTRAYVHTLIPSLFASTKVASPGEVIGAIRQDRATAILGRLGPAPEQVPFRITLESERGPSRTFSVTLANDQLFTPLLAYVTVLNVLQSYERQVGAATFFVRGEARVKGHGAIAIDDIFAGDSPSLSAAASVATPMMVLLRNDLAPVELEGVDLTIVSTEQPRTAAIERVWLDDTRLRAGGTVNLKVLMRSYRGEESVRTIPVTIPATARGPFTLLVSDGTRLAQWEQREWRQALETQSVAQLIRVFNTTRRNNRLYVRLVRQEAGAVVRGEPLPALPPSALAVLEADRSGGSFTPLRSAVVAEWEFPLEYAVTGARQLTFALDPN